MVPVFEEYNMSTKEAAHIAGRLIDKYESTSTDWVDQAKKAAESIHPQVVKMMSWLVL